MVEAASGSGKSLARPQIAQALITAGHVATVAEAFDRYLGEDSPAYVPHSGASPAEVVELIVSGGGIPSLAHPGYRPKDEIIPGLVDAGLVGIEAYHSSHDAPRRRTTWTWRARTVCSSPADRTTTAKARGDPSSSA
jgi:3',5'-nucleoside bisphosphate phosphatase